MCPYQPMEAVNRRQLKTNGDELTVLEGIQNVCFPVHFFLSVFFQIFIYRRLISKETYRFVQIKLSPFKMDRAKSRSFLTSNDILQSASNVSQPSTKLLSAWKLAFSIVRVKFGCTVRPFAIIQSDRPVLILNGLWFKWHKSTFVWELHHIHHIVPST